MAKLKVMHYQHADDKRSNIPTASIAGQGYIPGALNIHERISTRALPWVEASPEERRPWDNCVPTAQGAISASRAPVHERERSSSYGTRGFPVLPSFSSRRKKARRR